jgi:hypothetical protein
MHGSLAVSSVPPGAGTPGGGGDQLGFGPVVVDDREHPGGLVDDDLVP